MDWGDGDEVKDIGGGRWKRRWEEGNKGKKMWGRKIEGGR
jgi:hypothetical protein